MRKRANLYEMEKNLSYRLRSCLCSYKLVSCVKRFEHKLETFSQPDQFLWCSAVCDRFSYWLGLAHLWKLQILHRGQERQAGRSTKSLLYVYDFIHRVDSQLQHNGLLTSQHFRFRRFCCLRHSVNVILIYFVSLQKVGEGAHQSLGYLHIQNEVAIQCITKNSNCR